MSRKADAYAWRFITTALSFTLFGLGGIVLGALAVPILVLLPGTRQQRAHRGRLLVRLAFRAFIGFMNSLGGLTYELTNFDLLGRPGQLIVANHPSLIDVVFMLAFIPDAGCVIKRELWRNPATALVVRGAGYIPNRPTDEMLERAAASLSAEQALVMFPEGTRTRPGQPLLFHRGAANVAIRSARVVTPVFVTVVPTTLTKATPWYRIPARRPHFALRVGEDIDPEVFRKLGPLPKASRELNDYLRSMYTRTLMQG